MSVTSRSGSIGALVDQRPVEMDDQPQVRSHLHLIKRPRGKPTCSIWPELYYSMGAGCPSAIKPPSNLAHTLRICIYHDAARPLPGHRTIRYWLLRSSDLMLHSASRPLPWPPFHMMLVFGPISFHNPCCHHHPGFYHRHNGQLIHRTATAQYLANQISDSFYSHHRTSHHRTSHHRTSHHRI